MKFFYFVIFVMLGASGFFAYKDGYLASVHPLLDPSVQRSGEDDSDNSEVAGEESGDDSAQSPGSPSSGSSDATSNAKELATAERMLAKEEKAERERLAKETRLAEREAKNVARKAAEAERLQRKTMLDSEIEELRVQYDAVYERQKQGREKMRQQESVWAQERIKTREVEKQELRDASSAFLDQLQAQMDEIGRLIQEKKKLY